MSGRINIFQFFHYVVCISNVKMTESGKESFVWGKQILRHSKPGCCVLLIVNLTYVILGMFSSHFIIFTVHNV